MTDNTNRLQSHSPQRDGQARMTCELLAMLERGDGEDAAAAVAALDWLRRDGDEAHGSPNLAGGSAAR